MLFRSVSQSRYGAADSKINLSGSIPSVEDALSDWLKTIKIGVTTKSVVDFQLSESIEYIDVLAVLQPFTTKQLQIKPEGQRGWDKISLWIKGSDTEFCLDDFIYVDSKKYRIYQKFEWKNYGYIEYQAIQSFGHDSFAIINESVGVTEGESIEI